ncbi:MAG: hypothetical protein KatS3mg097_418 [Candidatus Parcubacteria bacterium]|nr:MAG: hypothetical protein KatS3mg097_418 [Candidatus Parcubacteria bacterium]
MRNFLLGFFFSDLLLSLILYFKPQFTGRIDDKLIFFSIISDIFLILVLLLSSYVRLR